MNYLSVWLCVCKCEISRLLLLLSAVSVVSSVLTVPDSKPLDSRVLDTWFSVMFDDCVLYTTRCRRLIRAT